MKIKEIKGEPKPWEGKNGTVYYHNLVMDNGDKINIGKLKPLSVGEDLEYEITGDDQQEFRKAHTPQSKPQSKGGYSVDQDAILYQVCLKGVFDYYTTNGVTHFEADKINELTLSIAKGAKTNINALKQS